ncbi:protein trichome birefringence-like 3 isoform X1 [Tasmannia lanceolata]|uniref:protein trichome birefringence-like 3 isoform X1 n=1 Tax=Tasmannia lanceolata TaxID=3420 RepID=UPI004064B3E6
MDCSITLTSSTSPSTTTTVICFSHKLLMKPSKVKLPLSIMDVIVCAFAFAGLLYAEDICALTRTSILKLTPCSKQDMISEVTIEEKVDSSVEEDFVVEKMEFNVDKCNVVKAKWVFNSSTSLYIHSRIVRIWIDKYHV